jgi:hypothetical protein
VRNAVRCWWLPPVILATQEAEIKRISLKPALANSSLRPYLKKSFTHTHTHTHTHIKIGLVEWLKVKADFKPQYCKKKKKKREECKGR